MPVLPSKFMSSLVCGLAAASAGNYVSTRIGKKHYEHEGKSAMFDVGHLIVPQMNISPVVLFVAIVAWVPFLCALPFATATELLKKVGIRFVALLALRAITNTVTIFPKSDPACETPPVLSMLVNGACYDQVFSGHMVLVVLVSLAFVQYGVWPMWGGYIYSAGMALLLLLTRGHYSVDIVLGAALAYLSWTARL